MTAADINSALHRQVRTGTIYDAFMPPSDCSSKKLGNGDTAFALKHMAKTALKYQHQTRTLTTKFFSGISLLSLCNELHQFLFWHFQYAIDGDKQLLRSPACSWVSRFEGIDCKSYSIFASTVLLNAGVRHYMRRIVQASNPNAFTHVYIVVPKNQTTGSLNSGYYVIDGTINTMQELPFLRKDDLQVGASPTPSASPISTLGALAAADTSQTTSNDTEVNDLNDQLTELMNQSYNLSKEVAQETANYHNQANVDKVKAIGTATSTVASAVVAIGTKTALISNAVPGIGTAIGLCLAAVTSVVALAIMMWGNPCAGAFYTSNFINENLKRFFYDKFRNTVKEIENKLAQGVEAAAITSINHIIREVDLGVAHYRHECKIHNQKCSSDTLLSYKDFVDSIKSAVDELLQVLVLKLKENYNVQIIEKQADTSARSWYFIVPTSRNAIRASFRYLQVEPNKQQIGAYPYQYEETFIRWLDDQATTIAIKYGSEKANAYKSEMLPFNEKISTIRDNVWLPVITRYNLERPLQLQQQKIYLKYEQEYAQQLKDEEQEALRAYRESNKNFWKDLQKLRAQRLNDERKSFDNIKKIAQITADDKAKLQDKKTIQLALVGVLGIGVIYAMSNNNKK